MEDPFWSDVLHEARMSTLEIAELKRLEQIVSRSRFIAQHGFNIERLKADPNVQRFLDLQFAIFETVSRISGKPVLVDSSKAGPRAWILACDARTTFVHLYRNPESVIASWRSRKFDKGLGTEMQRLSVPRAAVDWWKVEYSARKLAKQRTVAILDYDAMCHFPRETINKMLKFVGFNDLQSTAWLDTHTVQPGANYHSLNGNPDRFDQGPLRISARATDWSDYSLADRLSSQFAGRILASVYRPLTQKRA